MSRLPKRFRTLRWRLTLSFFVAAFVAMMSLESVFVIVPTLFAGSIPLRPVALLQGLEQTAPQLSAYVAQTPPDRAGLAGWLRADTTPVANIPSGVAIDTGRTIAVLPGQNAAVTVMGTNRQALLSATPAASDVGNLGGIQNTPEARAVIAAALGGRTDDADALRSTPDGRTVVAAPIRDTSGQVRGALFLGADLPALRGAAMRASIASLLLSIIPFAFIAGVLGTLFGLLTARQFTRRLRGLTAAAQSWSKGEFGVAARDPSEDELGQLAHDLNRMAEQIQALLATRQELAVVEERNRLARDLHDSVKQQMFAASMQVAAARALVRRDPAAAEARLSNVERMVNEAQRELTALILELRPAALASKGLAPALREYCDEWARRVGIAVDVRVRGERPAPLEVEQALFRVAQEALANVAKHSGATRAEVQLTWEPSALVLTITDNGAGFDAVAVDGKGVGLASMRERIEAVGGALSIGGVAGEPGTRVEACVPLAAPALAAGSATKASDAARA
ncbi:MAG TPA: sensor histidine kinase [Ktedonobacterales bacterium]|nr:sensor histidine kinase [Ktedonobacterales bacterium]